MPLQELEIYEFGPFELHPRERTLKRGSECVSLTPKVFDLLVLLVENQGKLLDKDFLLKSLWPGTFVEEANLSVNVSTLRRALVQTLDGPVYIETVPKRGYRFVAAVTKRAAEETVDRRVHHLRPADVELDPPKQAPSPYRASFIALLGILLVVGVVVAWMFARPSRVASPGEQLESLAILPFRSLTSQAEEERLGAGMSSALIQHMTNSHNIAVRSPSGVLKYANFKGDPVTAGKELQVDAVLDGTIQREGDHIRVTVQLCRVRDHASLWADHFDDRFSNIFAVQDSIADMVAKKLALQLSELDIRGMRKRYTDNTEAYGLYMQGEYHAALRTRTETEIAADFFKKAIEKDPNFALAYAGLASAYINVAGTGHSVGYWDEARRAADKAIRLDNSLSHAHLALGKVKMRRDWDWSGAEREFTAALELAPNSAPAHAARSTLLTALARRDEAIKEMHRACQLDPQSANYRSDLAWTYYCARKNKEAIENSRLALLLDAQSDVAHRQLEKEYLIDGKYAEAEREYQLARDSGSRQASGSIADLALIYVKSGKRQQADDIYSNLKRLPSPETISNFNYEMAKLASALGHVDEAIDFITKAQHQRLARAIWMAVDPEMDGLRSNPRTQSLLAQANVR